MMRITNKLSWFAVVVVISGVSSAQAGATGSPSISISISAYRDAQPAGVPLKIKAEVENTSGEPIWDSRYGYEVMVWDESGRLAAKTENELKREHGPMEIRRKTIEPGVTKKHVFVVSDIYDISRPGRYSIKVQRGEISSNTIMVAVTDAASAQASAGPSNASFSLEIDASQDVVKVGSKIVLEIETTNNTQQVLNVDNSSNMYSVSVQNAQGVSPPITDIGQKQQELFGRSSGNVAVQLKPGEAKLTSGIRIDDMYDFSQPGEYIIEISRTDEESKTLVKSNKVTVTVVR